MTTTYSERTFDLVKVNKFISHELIGIRFGEIVPFKQLATVLKLMLHFLSATNAEPNLKNNQFSIRTSVLPVSITNKSVKIIIVTNFFDKLGFFGGAFWHDIWIFDKVCFFYEDKNY